MKARCLFPLFGWGPWARILWWGLYDNLCVLLSYVQLEENIWKQIRIKNIKKRKGSHRLWDIRRLNETDYINTRVFWTAVSVCSGPSVFLSFQCFSYICLSIDIWSIIYFCLYFLSDSDSQSLNRGHHWPAEASSLILLCLLKEASEWSFKCKLTTLFCYFLYLSYF